jgi:hypothetical protein
MQNFLQQLELKTDTTEMEILTNDGKTFTDDEAQKPCISLYGSDNKIFKDNVEILKDKNGNDKMRVLLVESWRNIVNDEGIAIECTPENATKLFKKYILVGEQADKFILDRANWLKK